MDGFLMEVEWIQQRGELKEEGAVGGESQLPEGEEPWLGPVGCWGKGKKNMTGARREPEQEGAFPHIRTDAVSSSLVSLPSPCSQPSGLSLFRATVI